MRLLANENVSRTVVEELRALHHDVVSVRETHPSKKDIAILEIAQAEKRIVLTHDKDFGELAFRAKLPAECGVILLRLSGDNPEADNRRAVDAIASRLDWPGHFSVILDDRIRMRLLRRVQE